MSADGRMLAFPVLEHIIRALRDEFAFGDRVFDISEHELRWVGRPYSYFPLISGDGKLVLRFQAESPIGDRNEVRDVATGEILRLLPTDVSGPCTGCYRRVVDSTGDRIAFVRPGGGISLYERGIGVRRVTPTTQPGRTAAYEAALSRDGLTLAFAADSDFDPSASTGGQSQIFVYDVVGDSLRQLTGRADPGDGAYAYQPRLSVDGRRLSYRPSRREIRVVDVASGALLHSVDVGPDDDIGDYHFSDDGNVLAFMTTADLDPGVGNPARWSQLFRADLAAERIEQLTDVSGQAGLFEAMDADASVFFLRQ